MKRDGAELLCKLRQLMRTQACPVPLSAYIVPSEDAHQNEYIGQHDQRRSFISGFDGSAGTAVITLDRALLWTDGRYYQQALQQLNPHWELMKDGQQATPSIGSWLASHLPQKSMVGVDPKLLSYRTWRAIEKQLKSAGKFLNTTPWIAWNRLCKCANLNLHLDCDLLAIEKNLVDMVWGNEQPKRVSNPIISLGLEFAGKSISEKWADVKEKMAEVKAGAVVVSALDEIACKLSCISHSGNYHITI